jgi:CHAD domain-containing protein
MSDTPAPQPHSSVGEALRALARQTLADARGVIDEPARPDAKRVHDFRREAKRWRALLRLVEPFIGADGQRLRTQAGEIARALGGARDAQSALDALDDLSRHGLTLSPNSLTSLRDRITGIRQSAERTILTAGARRQAMQVLDEAAAAVELWDLRGLTFPLLAERLTRGYRAVRRAVPGDWDKPDAEGLHELRKKIIIHRYQMETVVPLWRQFGKMWIGEMQRLRNRLGAHQDLLLLERLTDSDEALTHWRSRLRPAIEQRKTQHVRGARRIAERLLVEKPKDFRRRLEAMENTGE